MQHICHSLFAIQWQMSKFDIRCVKLSCHWNTLVHFVKGGVMKVFIGGQRYFVRNSSDSKWSAPCVEGICQAVLPEIPEPSCSSFGRGKVISFLGRQDHFVRIKSDLIWTVPSDQGLSHLLLPSILYGGCLSIWREKIHNEMLWVAKLFYAQNH